MSICKISCTVGATDLVAKLALEIWLDQTCLYNCQHINFKEQHLEFDLPNNDAEHELRFVMKNKTVEHTQVSDSGEILKDACLIIKNIAFDGIVLDQIFVDQATYTHDFNGTKSPIVDKFYGEIGCNGTVSLKFITPMYLWLLDNL